MASPSHAFKVLIRNSPSTQKERKFLLGSITGELYEWRHIKERLEKISRSTRSDCLIVFRHGATKYNERHLITGQHNTALSERGRNQALQLQAEIPEKIDLIVTSTLGRSIETMLISVPDQRRLTIPAMADARLNEIKLGVLEGKKRRFIPAFDAGDLDYSPEGGETYREAAQRIFSSLVDILDLLSQVGDSPRNAVLFCHAGVIRVMATLTVSGGTPRDVFKTDVANAKSIRLCSDNLHFPSYWGDGTVGDRSTHRRSVSRVPERNGAVRGSGRS